MKIVPRLLALAVCTCGLMGMESLARGADPGALGAATFKASANQPVGWRGDGTGHFPGATPPMAWSRKPSGAGYELKGLAWVTPLPAGGISSPIVVGDKVFVTMEGQDLVCADKATGKLLWIRSNLELEALSPEEGKDVIGADEKIPALVQQLKELNVGVVEEINATLPNAAAFALRAGPLATKKKAVEKQIQEALNKIDKKRFDHSWPQGVYGYCTQTPVSDGKQVYAYFSQGVSVAYDLDGNRKWIVKGASGGEEKGNYTSPLIADGQFIVWGGPDMRAYDVASGKVLWSNVVKGANASSLYSFHLGSETVAAYRNYFIRIRDGKAIWASKDIDNSTTTPIVAGNAIITWIGGDKGALKVLRIPDDTETGKPNVQISLKTEWADDELPKSKERPFDRGFCASPLFVDGIVYRICSGGGLIVNDATTGEILYRKILPMKPRTAYWAWGGASTCPSLAGKNIYLMDNQGTTVIIQPGREYKELAVNHIDDSRDGKEQVQNLANPFFEGSRIYYRSPNFLYCIGEK